jgi:hypothetical protein
MKRSAEISSKKKSYQPPKLSKYGSLTQMTLSKNIVSGQLDATGNSGHKTV